MTFVVSIRDTVAAVSAAAFGEALDPIISNIISPAIALLFAIALVVFSYGVLRYVWGSNDGDARSHAKMSMIGGIIGMFIMMSAWGIVHLIANTVKSL